MAAANVIVLLSLFILPVVLTSDTEQPLTLVVNALSKLVGYYISNYRNVNLDGLYGLRVVEGQLDLLLKEHAQGLHQHLSASMVSRLQQMLELATNTSHDALHFVKQDDEEYYMRMQFLIEKPWNYLKKHRKLNQAHIWPPSIYLPQMDLSEEKSDQCMMELLGTGKKAKCSLSSECLTIMTRRGLYGYGITHQILWTMLAEKTGCGDVVNFQLKNIGAGGIDEEQAVFCANNFHEMESSVHSVMHGTIQPTYQDLFLEQQFVCPSLGFYEFLSSEYLQQILSWQLPSGCYGNNGEGPEDIANERQSGGKNDISRQAIFKEALALGQQAKKDQVQTMTLPQRVPAGQAVQNVASPQPALKMPGQALARAARQDQGRLANQQGRLTPDGNILAAEKAREQKLLSGNNQAAGQNPLDAAALNHLKLKNSIAGLPQGALGAVVPPRAVVPNWRQAIQQAQNAALDPMKQPARGWPKDKPRSLQTVPSQHRQGQGQGSDGPIPPRPVPYVGNQQLPGGLRSPFLHRALRNPGLTLGRKLLSEKELAGGCLSHKTAVAAGALTMYLRYLVDPGPMVLNQTGHILQETSRMLLEKGNMAADSQKVKREGLIPVKQNMIHNEDDFKEEEEEEDADENPIDNTLDGGAEGDNMDFNEDEDEDEDLEEDNADEDANYKDDGDTDADYNDANGNDDEMYPENNNIDPNNRDRKIVHFGGDRQGGRGPGKHTGAGEDENGAAVEGKKKDTADQQAQDDVEYTYYDEPNEESEKKSADLPKKESVEKGKAEVPYMGHQAEYPKEMPHKDLNSSQLSPKVMYFIFSISFFILFFLAYKFIRRRRLHIRYGPKGFFRL